jgi:hypothetical protein
MAFCLLNKTRTWLEIEVGGKTVILQPGVTMGPFEENDIKDDTLRKIANTSLVPVATVTVYPDKPVDSIMVDLNSLPPDGSDSQPDNEDKDVE